MMVQVNVAAGAVGSRSSTSAIHRRWYQCLTLPAVPQSIVEAVPPSTCESTDTLTLVSGVLWKLTVASLSSPTGRLGR